MRNDLGIQLRRFAESHGTAKTAQFFKEGLKKFRESGGKAGINPKDIALRPLAEQMLGYDWHPRLERYRRAIFEGRLKEAADAVDASSFVNITGQLLVDAVWDKYNSPEFIGRRLVRTVPCGPNLGEHKVPGHSRVLNAPSRVQPGESFPHTVFRERWKVLAKPEKYGEICAVTFEMIASDLTGQARESAESVGWQVAFWEEEQKLKVVMGLTNNYQEAVGGATSPTTKNTYQSTDWDNTQTGETLTSLRPIQKLRTQIRRITDPDTGKRIAFVGNYPLLVMPNRELDALRIVTATQVRMGDVTVSPGDQTISDNPLRGVSEVLTSSIAEQLLTDSGVSQANADEYFWHGDFQRAFYWREVHPLQVTEAPPMNPLEFNQDIVLAVRAKIFGVAGVWEPRYVGESRNN